MNACMIPQINNKLNTVDKLKKCTNQWMNMFLAMTHIMMHSDDE